GRFAVLDPARSPPGIASSFTRSGDESCRSNSKSRNCAPSFHGATTAPNGARLRRNWRPPRGNGSRKSGPSRTRTQRITAEKTEYQEGCGGCAAPSFWVARGGRDGGEGRGAGGGRKARYKAMAPSATRTCHKLLSAHRFWWF